MRISSLLRRTLGLKGHRVAKVYQDDRKIVAEIVPRKRSRPIC